MENKAQIETQMLDALAKRLTELDIAIRREDIAPKQEAVTAQFKPRKGSDLILEYMFSFVPDFLKQNADFLNLQTFVEISGPLDTNLIADLNWMTSRVNPFLPIGAFGVFERFGMLYWKQNNFLDGTQTPNHLTHLILAQSVFSQEIILDFHPSFLDVINNKAKAEESLRKNKWSKLMFAS